MPLRKPCARVLTGGLSRVIDGDIAVDRVWAYPDGCGHGDSGGFYSATRA